MENKKEKYPFISIIFPNWNGENNTLECLDSLEKLNYPKNRMEIIIVDNGSTDGSQESIKKKFKEMKNSKWFTLKLIENQKNIGAPAAYNRGIKEANPDYNYIWKLDNDIVVDKDSLIELVKAGESSSKFGTLNGKIYYYNNPNIIWSVGLKLLWFIGACIHIGKNQKDNNRYNSIHFFDHLAGCSVLIKKTMMEKLDKFYEDYFIYYDDIELSLRSTKFGFKNVYVPTAKIWHKIHRSIKKDNPKFIYYRTRNSFIFMKRNFNFLYYIIYIILFFPLSFLKILRWWKTPININSYINGVKDGLRH
ncbi:hypothetical protein DRN69_07450 [Candidatus Pacearchaeota archaeon]|nr:MAG: hypothetical protein DRN69_07450 [Candidatus Pacearchaeota archaeon]